MNASSALRINKKVASLNVKEGDVIRVVSSNGRTVYAQALPQAEKAGEKTTTTIDLSNASVGPECTVIVGDYAGNETAYTVEYGGTPEDFTGRMFGFTSAATRETRGQRWVEIDPMGLYYDGVFDYGGVETYYTADTEVYAAEYVAGYVFYADKTDLYVAPQDDLSAYMTAARNYTATTGGREFRDMAYNSQDGKLYALGYENKFYTVDLITGTLEQAFTVADAGSYYGGTLCVDMLVVHDGSAMFGVDPDTFQVTSYGPIASTWQWSDAAYAAREGKAFGKLFGISNEGAFLEILNAAAGEVNYWDLTEQFADDPMAVIAYWRSEYWDHDYDLDSNDWPAHIFYMMTESGALYTLSVYTSDKGKSYGLEVNKVGDSSIQLTGVSSVTGGVSASMLFDEATGSLLISSYQEGSTTQLYVLDPVRLIPALVDEFGENTYPVTALYQYDRATDLTLRMDTGDVQLYAGDTKQIPARVVLGATNALTWTSDNESVATVDANGVVAGVSKGTASITATTVDTDKNGRHLFTTRAPRR